MIPVTSQIFRALPQVSKTIIPMRTSVISGPPKNKISTPELLISAVLLGTAILGVPAWVLVNMRSYGSPKE